MKSSGLLSILTFSEKRKDLLFLLQENPRNLSDIKEYFDVRSPEILPRLKEMENANLIVRREGVYRLTPLGKVTASYYKPFLDTLTAIEANEAFWKEHDLLSIPETLLNKIQFLKECRVIKDENECIYDSHKTFLENVQDSSKFMGFSSIFLPHYPSMFLQMAQKNISVSIIVTPNVFFKIKNEHSSEIEKFLEYKHANFYVYDSAKIAFVVTDRFFSLSLFYKNETFDPRNDLVGFDTTSIKWGEELFNHFKENSVEIKTI